MEIEHLNRSQLARRLGVSRTTLWSYQRAGIIPAPQPTTGKRALFGPAAIMVAESAVLAARGA